MSRYWCLFVSSVVFCIAQISAILIENPHLLVLHSGLTGCKAPSILSTVMDTYSEHWA